MRGAGNSPRQFMYGLAAPIRPADVVRELDMRESRSFSCWGVGETPMLVYDAAVAVRSLLDIHLKAI